MKKIRGLQNNIKLFYIYIFIQGLFFDRALWVLYLVERGINMSQVGVLEALLHMTIVFFEVPTGIIADLYGRKTSILIGQMISLFYAIFMLISGNLFFFSLAFSLLGLSITFKSGAEQALVYDTLLETKQEGKFTKILGNQTAIILFSLSLAKLAGGLIAETSWSILYISIFIFQLLGILPLLLMKEPARINEKKKEPIKIKKYVPIRKWKEQIDESIVIWKNEKSLRLPIILYVSLITVMIVIVFYSQEYFSRLGYKESTIGIIFTVESLLGVAAAKIAYRFERKWRNDEVLKVSFYIFILLIIIFACYHNFIAVISLFLLGMVSEFVDPIFSNMVQIKIHSKIRATFFSMISLLNSFAIMIIFPSFGYLIDYIGFNNAFFSLSLPLISILIGNEVLKRLGARPLKNN